MEVIKEQIDDLNASVTIQLTEEDYKPKVDSALKDIKKKVNMPGFRPGMVPIGLVKKMYGTSVIVDEVNKLVSESLNKYITDEKLEIIGEPIPSEKQKTPIDFDNQKEFEFIFDLGLRPEIEINLNKRIKIPYYIIKPDEDLIEQYIKSYTGKYGQVKEIDEVEDKAFIKGDFIELDEEGNEKEEGIRSEMAPISLDHIKDEEIKKELIGKKKGDEVKFDPRKIFSGNAEAASVLKIKEEEVENLNPNFKYIIKEITKFEEAELNQELFDKVFGEGEVKSEEEFREKIIEEIKENSKADSDYRLGIDAKEKLVAKFDVSLPEEFLKRWLKLRDEENKLSDEEFEKEFPKILKDLKWQLISSQIAKDNDIKVEYDEVKELAMKYVEMQFIQYGLPAGSFGKEQLEQYATDMFLKKEDEVRRLYDQKYLEKVIDVIKESVKLDEKEITNEEFSKLFEDNK
ncbi:MAG: trigger factor [Bacteroidales bacterium]|nr:trigger factor [Bacteroidales bacterium]